MTKSVSALQRSMQLGRHGRLRRSVPLYAIAAVPILYYLVFCYLPMFGLVIAFKDFSPYMGAEGIFSANWVGFKYFEKFMSSSMFWRAFRNNIVISGLGLLICYPANILLALMINEIRRVRFKRAVQTITYLPHFLSTMVIVSLIAIITDEKGLLNTIITRFGGETNYFLMNPGYFKWIIVISNLWQEVGWGSIMFLAALTSIDDELYHAAAIDGAGRFKRMWHISLPGMSPIIAITLILNVPSLLGASFEKILLLYNTMTMPQADVLSTYTFRVGLVNNEYSYSSAVGLFVNVLSVVLLLGANFTSKKLGQEGIW